MGVIRGESCGWSTEGEWWAGYSQWVGLVIVYCMVLGVPSPSVWKVLCICVVVCDVCRVWREDALEGR